MSNETLVYIGIIVVLTAVIIILIATHIIKSEFKKDVQHSKVIEEIKLLKY